jgi:hypothetical protein
MAVAGASFGVALAPSASADTASPYSYGFHASGTDWLWSAGGNGSFAPASLGMAPGSSPAMANLSTGGYAALFSAYADSTLWTFGSGSGGAQYKLGNGQTIKVAQGSSPSISATAGGGWYGAVADAGNHLLALKNPGGSTPVTDASTGAAATVYPGSSPAVAAVANGATNQPYEIVYTDAGSELKIASGSSATVLGNGLGADPGTSPAIAADQYGNWKVAFQAYGEHTLWTVNSNGTITDTHLGMKPGTSPSITATGLGAGSYEIAYYSDDSKLSVVSPSGASSLAGNGLGVQDGTSPAIASDGKGGWKVAFQSYGEKAYWTVDSTGAQTDTRLGMAAGTGPAITGAPPTSVGYPAVSTLRQNGACLTETTVSEIIDVKAPMAGNQDVPVFGSGANCSGAAPQQFAFTPVSGGVQIKNAADGHCLLGVICKNGDPSQVWTFRYNSPTSSHFHIVNAGDPTQCLAADEDLTTAVAEYAFVVDPTTGKGKWEWRVSQYTYHHLTRMQSCSATAADQDYTTGL